MWVCRDDARIFPDVGNAGIFQLFFKPGELVRELLPHRPGDLEFEQEGTAAGVADNAFELTEVSGRGCDGTADLADHGTRVVRQAKVRGFPCRSYQFARV